MSVVYATENQTEKTGFTGLHKATSDFGLVGASGCQ
jgi:hypothetical protein